jgi:fido (protein-threonine AMPylation protein)
MYYEDIPYKETSGYGTSPEKRRYLWDIGFGLQSVDGLRPSPYMQALAEENIEGKKTYSQIENDIENYYNNGGKAGEREADIVSLRIAELLNDDAFTLDTAMLSGIHRHLFSGVLDIPVGEFRRANIIKNEAVLSGDTVQYGPYLILGDLLYSAFSREKETDYRIKRLDEKAHSAMRFISLIWQIHPFYEGNTRTSAVFAIKYFRYLGFDAIDNEPFKEHSEYFRNALVLDNYGACRQPEYLIRFTENILLGGGHRLDNAKMISMSNFLVPATL